MARHMVCNMPDEEIYKKQCISLEKNLPGIVKIEELHDVDDSKIMKYVPHIVLKNLMKIYNG